MLLSFSWICIESESLALRVNASFSALHYSRSGIQRALSNNVAQLPLPNDERSYVLSIRPEAFSTLCTRMPSLWGGVSQWSGFRSRLRSLGVL